MHPAPTMAGTLAASTAALATLEHDIRADLTHAPDSAERAAVVTALDTLRRRCATANALGAFADADAADLHYQAVAKLRKTLRILLRKAGRVPEVGAARTVAGNHEVGQLTALANQLLLVITTAHQPQLGVPSVGFEYELPGVLVETDVPAKTLVAHWMHNLVEDVRLETDGGHAEFVTVPVGTIADVNRQLATIRQVLAQLSQNGRVTYQVPVPVLSAEDGRVLHPANFPVTLRHTEGESKGRVQATAACALVDIPELIVMHANGIGNDGFADDPVHPEAVALARLVNYYLLSLARRDGSTDTQGPKVKLAVMCRTSLHGLYANLPGAEQTEFEDLIDYQGGSAVRANRLLPHGYKGPGGANEVGPTVGEWLDSIVDGCPTSLQDEPLDRDNEGAGPRGPNHDLMSPPPGYPAHRKGRHFTYAMGHYAPAGDGSALLEVREIWAAGNYSVDRFVAQAAEFAGQRFEAAATRQARVQAAVNAAVAHVCAGRATRNGDVGRVRARLVQTLVVTERPLAEALIRGALAAWVGPVVVPPPRNRKRDAVRPSGWPAKKARGDDDEEDSND